MQSEKEKLAKLVEVFNELFEVSEYTKLQPGHDEPFYRAAVNNSPAVIYSRNDYFSSALHEIAHWCIAGKERRLKDDFGYWYKPEGRSADEQIAFELVEVKPQALEWAFSLACNHHFHFSADNLSQAIDASENFKLSVKTQLITYLSEQNLPSRAALLFNRLNQVFRNNQPVELLHV